VSKRHIALRAQIVAYYQAPSDLALTALRLDFHQFGVLYRETALMGTLSGKTYSAFPRYIEAILAPAARADRSRDTILAVEAVLAAFLDAGFDGGLQDEALLAGVFGTGVASLVDLLLRAGPVELNAEKMEAYLRIGVLRSLTPRAHDTPFGGPHILEVYAEHGWNPNSHQGEIMRMLLAEATGRGSGAAQAAILLNYAVSRGGDLALVLRSVFPGQPEIIRASNQFINPNALV
jgi:hypothetical protein